MIKPAQRLCACGCGTPVLRGCRKFIHGHSSERVNMKRSAKREAEAVELPSEAELKRHRELLLSLSDLRAENRYMRTQVKHLNSKVQALVVMVNQLGQGVRAVLAKSIDPDAHDPQEHRFRELEANDQFFANRK